MSCDVLVSAWQGALNWEFAIFGVGSTIVPPPKPVLEASENGIRLVCAWGVQNRFGSGGFMACYPLP